MHTSLKQLEDQALSLSPEERAKLADAMLASLSLPLDEIENAWKHEIAQRISAYDRGELPAYAAEDVFAEANHISK